jgi:hypothetical protein
MPLQLFDTSIYVIFLSERITVQKILCILMCISILTILSLLVEYPCVATGYQVLYLVYLYIIYVNITGFCWMYDQIFFYAHLSPSASSISGISLSYRNMVFTTAI